MSIDRQELTRRFTYRPPDDERTRRHRLIREDALAFGLDILEATAESREQSLALTALDEVVFWSNAAIARRDQ